LLRENKKDFISWFDKVFKPALIECKDDFKKSGIICSVFTEPVLIKSQLSSDEAEGVDLVLSLMIDFDKPTVSFYTKIDELEFDTAVIYTGIWKGLQTPFPVKFKCTTKSEIESHLLRTYIDYSREYRKTNLENKYFKYLRILEQIK